MTKDLAPTVFRGPGAVGEEEKVAGLFALTPAESKRLIAKAVAALPVVKKALKKGKVVITTGSTTRYVAEEILGKEVSSAGFLSGHILDGLLAANPDNQRMFPFVLIDGKVEDVPPENVLPDFTADDVFIKSANAIDPNGYVGVIMANDLGGTIGGALGILQSRGVNLVVPIGLEKMIPSVPEAAKNLGVSRVKYKIPSPTLEGTAGMMPLVTADVVTEIVALKLLTGVDAIHVASGGIGGSEGSVVLRVEGSDDQVQKAMELVKGVKGEPNIPRPY